MVSNLLALASSASLQALSDGRLWYPRACAIVDDWARFYGYHRDTVACVVAAVSPQVSWARNLIVADDILAGRPPSLGVLPANVRKAESIRNANIACHPNRMMLAWFPYGPKVQSFACNLAMIDTMVTVDGHALQAALDDPTTIRTLKPAAYLEVATAYLLAARQFGDRPCDFQAICWLAWKARYPLLKKRELRRQW